MTTFKAAGEVYGQVFAVDGRTVDVEIPYNVIDRHGTVWLPGCFTASLQRRLPPVVMQHDHKTVVGRVVDFRDTPDAMRLRIRLADLDDVPDARRAQSLLRDGILDQVSFAFRDTRWTTDPRFGRAPACRATDLVEVSFVLSGSVPGARVLAVREDDEDFMFSDEQLEAIAAAADEYERAELDEEVRAAIAMLTLRSHHQRATPSMVAHVEAVDRRREQAVAQEKDVQRRLAAILARDLMPPDPVEEYFGTAESWTVNADAYMPDYPPQDVLRSVVDSGEMTNDEAVAAWRRRFGKKDTPRRPDDFTTPNAQGVMPLPPQDMIDAAVEGGMTPAEAIRRWRVNYGFEETS